MCALHAHPGGCALGALPVLRAALWTEPEVARTDEVDGGAGAVRHFASLISTNPIVPDGCDIRQASRQISSNVCAPRTPRGLVDASTIAGSMNICSLRPVTTSQLRGLLRRTIYGANYGASNYGQVGGVLVVSQSVSFCIRAHTRRPPGTIAGGPTSRGSITLDSISFERRLSYLNP